MAVRGAFDLNDRPASEALRRVREEGKRTNLVLGEIGRTMDELSRKRATPKIDLDGADDALARSDALQSSLKDLSRERATPKVDLDGVSAAIAQVELLERKLASLGRQTARPNVNLPVARMAAASAAGGGGGRGSFGRGLSIPFAGSIPWPLVAGALGAAPPLLGSATALLGSAGAATLGAGALGLTGYAVGGASAALTAPTAISTIKGIKEASKALAAYQQEVIKTGPNSKASAEKLRYYNSVLSGSPAGTERFLRAKTELGQEFAQASRPGQADITGIFTRGLNLGRQLTPLGSRLSNEFLGEGRAQFGNFANFLNDPRSRDFYRAMGAEATADLSNEEAIAEHVLGTIENIARASRPFFHEGIVFLDHWTGGWQKSTNDLHGTREEIGGMVDQLRSWAHLGGAGFDLLRDLLEPAAKPGQSTVDDLTRQLEEWDRWVKHNPRQVSEFFQNSAEGTEKIAGSLRRITGLLWKIGQQLAPLLEQGGNLVELLGNAGLLTPGGLPLFLAAGRGVRGVFEGRGGATGRTTTMTGAAPMVVGGAAAAEGRVLPRSGAFGRVAGAFVRQPAPLYSAGATEGESYFYRRSRFATGLSAIGTEYGPTASRFGSGFIRSFGPYLALSFGLGALGTRGDIGERLQGGLSQSTLGLIPPPPTADQRVEEGFRHALAQFKGQREDPNFLRKQWEESPHFTRFGPVFSGEPKPALRHRTIPALNLAVMGLREADPTSPEGAGEARFYQQRIEQIRQAQTQRAAMSISDIHQGFAIRRAHGASPEEAFGKSMAAIEARASELHGRTSKEFSQMSLDWARSLARSNPKVRGLVDELAERTEKRLHRMGEQVEIIHGKIVDVSGRSWGRVREIVGSETQLALSEANKNLTALEKRAFSILENMGYSRTQAQSIVHEAQTGRPTKAGSEANAAAHHHGRSATTINNMPPGGRGHALGGRLPMPASGSLHDVLHLGGGNYAAGGELLIDGREVANRHTERKVNRMLLMAGYNTTLAKEIANEGRAHHSQFREFNAAFGGRLRGRTFATGGGISAAGRLATRMGLSVSGGPGYGGIPSSGHAPNSLHYSGLAYDVSGSAELMRRYFFTAFRDFRGSINELFYDPIGWYLDEGHKVPGAIGGHSDHVHIGFFPSGARLATGVRGLRGGLAAAAARPQRIRLGAPGSRRRGIPGAAVGAAGAMEAAGLQRNINRLLGGGAGGDGGTMAHGRVVRGRVSWFSGGATAGGKNTSQPGIAMNLDPGSESGWNNATTQGWMDASRAGHPVRALVQIAGHRAILPITDLGPAGFTQRAIDVTEGGVRKLGFPLGAFPTDAVGTATILRALGGPLRRRGFAGWHAQGGHFRVKNPTVFGVGEAGPEDVHIIPDRKRRGSAAPWISVRVDLRGAKIGNEQDAERIGRKAGQAIADELAKGLESSDGVREKALTG